MSYQNFKRFPQKNQPEPTEFFLYKPYVGTGNSNPPQEIKEKIQRLAKLLEEHGYVLRTGGMDGPEDIFEKSVRNKELILPWKGFANKESKLTYNTPSAQGIAKLYHDNYDKMKLPVQAFLAKNVRLLYGDKLKSPALFMLCWSEDGAETLREKTNRTGSVGHAIQIAYSMRIPIFNLGKPDTEERLKRYLDLDNQGAFTGPVVKREREPARENTHVQEEIQELNF
jgi:hypothetical protein